MTDSGAAAGKPLTRAARRRQALAMLEEATGQTHRRIAEAAADVLAALDVKAAREADVAAADEAAGAAVRLILADGLSVDRTVELLRGAVTAADVQRYAAVTVVAAQEAVESDRVPYAERPASDGQPVTIGTVVRE